MDYINGVYMKKKQGQYGEYFILSFTQDGLENLQQLTSNDDGFRVAIASPQKANPEKFSVKPFVKKEDKNWK